MVTSRKPIPVNMPDDEVARLFERNDWVSAPVVDEGGYLVGRITIDDVVDVIREGGDHSLMSLAGLDEDDDTFAPAFKTARRRAVWLGVNLLTAFVASGVINLFQGTIEKVVALAVRLLDETLIRIGNQEYASNGDSYGSKISSSSARPIKVLSTPKKISANGLFLLKMAWLSAAPASPEGSSSTLVLFSASNCAIISSLMLKLSCDIIVMTAGSVCAGASVAVGAQAKRLKVNIEAKI